MMTFEPLVRIPPFTSDPVTRSGPQAQTSIVLSWSGKSKESNFSISALKYPALLMSCECTREREIVKSDGRREKTSSGVLSMSAIESI